MMQRTGRFQVAVALLFAASLTGCGEDPDSHPAAPQPQLTRVYVANYSPDRITAVHVKLTTDGDWGPNRIAGTIYGGDYSTFIGEFGAGRYDLRMVGDLQVLDLLDREILGEYIAFAYLLPTER